jgi:hypothetical protein
LNLYHAGLSGAGFSLRVLVLPRLNPNMLKPAPIKPPLKYEMELEEF